ncbi:MAG: cell division ATP-binding protein FtsE [Atopobiaceae bacterium]|nr:cell division ATP-binding protein FtsE [Atopobiaceae bacterium]
MAHHFNDGPTPDSDFESPTPDVPAQGLGNEEQGASGASSVNEDDIDSIMANVTTAASQATGAQPRVLAAPTQAPAQPSFSSVPDPMAPAQEIQPVAAEEGAPAGEPSAQIAHVGGGDEGGIETAPKTGTPTISLKNVTMVYPAQPNKPALDDVSVDIYAGEFVFLVGHSGSGKSTFIKTLTREIKVTSGKVIVAGQDLTGMRNWKVPYLRRQIGCVYQDFKLLPDKTIYENVAFALECIGKPRSVVKAQVPEVLRLVGLAEKMDVFPDQLSGGEQQRVSVARAMVNRPPLLICDEPTGNLDPAISLGIMKLLERINRTGTTVLMATHDREMVDSMRKRVIALENGHIVRDQERGGYGYYGAL